MTQKQTRRLLIVAFALSLLVHVIAVLFVRWPFRSPDEQYNEQIVHIVHVPAIRIARVATPPPLTPSPAPTTAPTSAPHPRVAHHPLEQHGTRPIGMSAPPSPPAAPPATPHATSTPNCASSDTPVTIAATPQPPDVPADARTSTTGGTARVRVVVNTDGSITSATLAQSSGDPQLDVIALSMARDARYAPATHACKPIAGDYAYTVRFVAW